ncbi:hypothetical protein KC19_7G040300 [Ceratodon purpureus]|uniref:Uncharacterized protein n=1 Tax=Ceratodon purpureus TaxID=3225 RepID=A0A8T0H7F4_CERPU|nr:hypothetical protein KC19_7G039400 [Ceratodon purpureus]KAG0566128.1 hypothetical protein KC19_7G040300 [Ceratodon purpureus]
MPDEQVREPYFMEARDTGSASSCTPPHGAISFTPCAFGFSLTLSHSLRILRSEHAVNGSMSMCRDYDAASDGDYQPVHQQQTVLEDVTFFAPEEAEQALS